MRIAVRQATAADADALAGLRWRWVTDGHGDAGSDRAAFVESFRGWVVAHESTHLPFLATVDGQPVGMAWLMTAERVPGPTQPRRRCGDVQSVYVVPELRGSGVGTALLEAVLTEARRLGMEHVTVHSSQRAVPLYQRTGFRYGDDWLHWTPA